MLEIKHHVRINVSETFFFYFIFFGGGVVGAGEEKY